MNFDDRLRSHLNDQTTDLVITPEGVEGVRARSRRRKQRRTSVAALSIAALAVVGALALLGPNDEQANLATDGDPAVTDTTAAPTEPAPTAAAATEPAIVDVALPEPGSALSLTSANNAGAPGGYNLFQTGRSNGQYFVVSTAPGVTYENSDGEYLRSDTLYTFDGATWAQSELSDRFVSGFDNSSDGVIYAVSTGSPTTQELAVGRTADGTSWEWTPIDLTAAFGPDKTEWPVYTVQQATRDGQRLVVVATNGSPNYDVARQLAIDAGADIGPGDEVVDASSTGVSWFVQAEPTPCATADNAAVQRLWDGEPEGPEIDFDRELTEAEEAEMVEFWKAREIREQAIRLQALEEVGDIGGCDEYVSCATEFSKQNVDGRAQVDDLLTALGVDQLGSEPLNDAQVARVDAEYAAIYQEQELWLAETGCGETLGTVDSDGGRVRSASWADLGVTPPESWAPAQFGYLIDASAVTDLGELFPGQTGFLLDLADAGGSWTATFDSTDYSTLEAGEGPIDSTFVAWTSSDGADWSVAPTSWTYEFDSARTLPNGVGLSISWGDEESHLIRRSADGTTNQLRLSDLAPDLDTAGYTLARVATGEYGAVVTAVNWAELEAGGNYNSIVLYSPDGVGWGATEVPDVEVVDAIVGSNDVVLFLNDPNRAPGSPQPILLGT